MSDFRLVNIIIIEKYTRNYHYRFLKSVLELSSLGTTGLNVIIKKNSFSFVRPVDTLEHLVLNGGVDANGPELFHDTPILCEDPLLAQDVVNLMKAVALVNEQMPQHLVEKFSHALFRLVSGCNLILKKIFLDFLVFGFLLSIILYNAQKLKNSPILAQITTKNVSICTKRLKIVYFWPLESHLFEGQNILSILL
jgi:hypothetical protein